MLRFFFSEYATIRAKVLEHYSKTSAARARLANRFRKQSAFRPGQRVVYRDPRARAAGGRTPWKEPLSDPYTIVSVQGNRLTLKTKQGIIIENAHAEDCLRLPEDVADCERGCPLTEDSELSRKSIGQMIEEAESQSSGSDAPAAPRGKLDKSHKVNSSPISTITQQLRSVVVLGRLPWCPNQSNLWSSNGTMRRWITACVCLGRPCS